MISFTLRYSKFAGKFYVSLFLKWISINILLLSHRTYCFCVILLILRDTTKYNIIINLR